MLCVILTVILGGVATSGASTNYHVDCCLPHKFEAHLHLMTDDSVNEIGRDDIEDVVTRDLDVYYDAVYKQIVFGTTYDVYSNQFKKGYETRSFEVLQDFNKLIQYTVDMQHLTCSQSPLADNFHKLCKDMMENDLEDHPMATVKYNATTSDVNVSMSMSIGNYFASTCAFVSSPKKTKPGQYLPLHPNRDQTMVIFRPYYETKVFSKGLNDVGFGYVTPGITDPDIFELPDFCM